MDASERRFVLLVSGGHGFQHFLRRMFPPLIPIWVIAFDFSLAVAGLILSAQTVGSALGQAPFGILSDRYDRRYIMPTGIAFAAIAVAAFATVPFLDVFQTELTVFGTTLTARLVVMVLASLCLGLGGSVLHPTGYPLISENVDPSVKGRALGMWGSAAKLGDGLAPAVVGLLLLSVAWPSILLLLAGAVFCYAVVLFFALGRYETRPARRLADDGTGTDEGDSDQGLPLADLDRRVYLFPILAVFAFFAIRMLAAGGVNTFIPEFITSEYSYTFVVANVEIAAESTASFYYSALLITAGVVQIGVGRAADAFDPRAVIIVMLLIATAFISGLALLSFGPAVLLFVLLGLGASLWGMAPARDALVSRITPADREGRTFGYLWTGALVVASFSPVLIGYIGDTAGLRTAFAILAVSTFLSAIPIALLYSDAVYAVAGDADRTAKSIDD